MHAAIMAGASDLVMPDAQQTGGVTGWLKAVTLARSANLPCSAHVFFEQSSHILTIEPSCDCSSITTSLARFSKNSRV